ncbi:hypothetical protein ACFQFC_20390 [Amorphoplanes digitatis]|uniref:Uncharacterized protein n=1 Tax=Actinoplanes digitatis TaxID=1868 RepID=A0A7W7I533_9ACTN|nr:hypothetical protein [Actinoplanes digitatis]MBB4766577.1 hypothetical protein [Actinoplanes digitatis]
MSAKRLGRFAAGLLVALGLAFGGVSLVAATTATAGATATQTDVDWS